MPTADKLAIQELTARFERAFDDGDIDLHMDTWADEITFRSDFGNYDTHADYREWVQGFSDQMQGAGGTRHLITNHEIDVNGDSATMICYLTILLRKDASIAATCRFDDELIKVDGKWKFRRRKLTSDQKMGS